MKNFSTALRSVDCVSNGCRGQYRAGGFPPVTALDPESSNLLSDSPQGRWWDDKTQKDNKVFAPVRYFFQIYERNQKSAPAAPHAPGRPRASCAMKANERKNKNPRVVNVRGKLRGKEKEGVLILGYQARSLIGCQRQELPSPAPTQAVTQRYRQVPCHRTNGFRPRNRPNGSPNGGFNRNMDICR